MTNGIALILFGALTVWCVGRLLLSAHFALKRRHMRTIMKDLTGEPNGQ